MATEMRNLSSLIQLHVENNYHLQPIPQSSGRITQELLNLGLPSTGPLNASHLTNLVLDSNTRYAALQFVISKVIFDSVTLDTSTLISLLPAFVPAFIRDLPPVEKNAGSTEAFLAAVTKWRQLSAFLFHPHRSDRSPLIPSADMSTQQAQQLAVTLNRFLEPFVAASDRDGHYEQENHLREVIVECATFGYLIFSQPSEIRFYFEGDDRVGEIAVFPGLERVSDEQGRRLPQPQVLIAPFRERLG
ncbi:hypothetical protein BX600DRAFT_467609 [Xylariales sp. PMI_506]|nr:hypothetical protein BX600DRAFT_467609 [Xylariales sp. PMI_506]